VARDHVLNGSVVAKSRLRISNAFRLDRYTVQFACVSAFPKFLMLVVLLLPVPISAAEFPSCKAVRDYLNGPRPKAAYARVKALESAVATLERETAQQVPDCDDLWIERAYFEHASELDMFSKTRPDGSAKRTWSLEAATAYGRYLEWFSGLPEKRRDRVIRILLTMQEATDDEFRKARPSWMRRRVGNVLGSMGAAYVNAQDHESLIKTHLRYAELLPDAFPNEVVQRWHKWLRAKPDFKRDQSDSDIKDLLASDSELLGQWAGFKGFLQRFVGLNPSVKDEWARVIGKITKWLA
jgi:hypothetical protein